LFSFPPLPCSTVHQPVFSPPWAFFRSLRCFFSHLKFSTALVAPSPPCKRAFIFLFLPLVFLNPRLSADRSVPQDMPRLLQKFLGPAPSFWKNWSFLVYLHHPLFPSAFPQNFFHFLFGHANYCFKGLARPCFPPTCDFFFAHTFLSPTNFFFFLPGLFPASRCVFSLYSGHADSPSAIPARPHHSSFSTNFLTFCHWKSPPFSVFFWSGSSNLFLALFSPSPTYFCVFFHPVPLFGAGSPGQLMGRRALCNLVCYRQKILPPPNSFF